MIRIRWRYSLAHCCCAVSWTRSILKEQLLTDSPISKTKDPQVPMLVIGNRLVDQYIRPIINEPLNFQTHNVGLAEDIKLIPFYQQRDHRYVVYWQTVAK